MQFAICVQGQDDGDLETWKVYRILPDEQAQATGCLRVIDESGADYLYPRSRFVFVELPQEAQAKLITQ
jgi:hypothetical protein